MADENNLMVAVLAQIGMDKLDYNALGGTIDVSSKAARERWRRLRVKLNNGKPATGASEDALMKAVLGQVGLEKLDYKALSDTLQVTPKAARERWRRLHAKLSSGSDKTISGGAKGGPTGGSEGEYSGGVEGESSGGVKGESSGRANGKSTRSAKVKSTGGAEGDSVGGVKGESSGGAEGESKSKGTKKSSTNKRKRAAANDQSADHEEKPSDGDMPKTLAKVRKGSGGKKPVTKKAKVQADNNENKAVEVGNGGDIGNGSDVDDVA